MNFLYFLNEYPILSPIQQNISLHVYRVTFNLLVWKNPVDTLGSVIKNQLRDEIN